ncbi:MAG: metal-dependent transcriptional regulator [Lentisphaerae bacterium]|nr:MAG: metal-dependent transcriptional regulator [Lentisphaerota bacterium]
MSESPKLSSNLEDYLETILILQSQNGVARTTEIAEMMHVKPASVTGALRALKAHNLINYRKYEGITVTDEGFQYAHRLLRRHRVLAFFLHSTLKIPQEEANQVACGIEHALTARVFNRFTRFFEFLHQSQCYQQLLAEFHEQLELEEGSASEDGETERSGG